MGATARDETKARVTSAAESPAPKASGASDSSTSPRLEGKPDPVRPGLGCARIDGAHPTVGRPTVRCPTTATSTTASWSAAATIRCTSRCPTCTASPACSSEGLLGTHQGAVQPSHLQAYLDEFAFRFNPASLAGARAALLPAPRGGRRCRSDRLPPAGGQPPGWPPQRHRTVGSVPQPMQPRFTGRRATVAQAQPDLDGCPLS